MEKCYTLVRLEVEGPWEKRPSFWKREPTINRQGEGWATVCRDNLSVGKIVACRACRARPGEVWVGEGREASYLCRSHAAMTMAS